MLKEPNEKQKNLILKAGLNADRWKVIWDDKIIYFPVENGDETAISENQRLGKIKFKNLTPDYKDGVAYLVNNITGEILKTIKNTIKIILH